MLEFAHALKLYGFRNENRVSLSIRSSATHVLTFYMDGDTFKKIAMDYATEKGALIAPYFVHQKSTYLRFTHQNAGYETNLRVPTEKWEALLREYREKLTYESDPLITCIVT